MKFKFMLEKHRKVCLKMPKHYVAGTKLDLTMLEQYICHQKSTVMNAIEMESTVGALFNPKKSKTKFGIWD
jgi:hypothetical protein